MSKHQLKEITYQDLADWKANRITQHYFHCLIQERHYLLQAMLNNYDLGEDFERTIAHQLGDLKRLELLLDPQELEQLFIRNDLLKEREYE